MPLSTEELVALEGKWVLAKRLGYDGALDGVTDLEDPDPYGFEAEYASDDIAGILTVKEITESDLVTSPEPYTIFVVGTELADPDTIEEDLSWKEEVAAHQAGKHDQKSHGNWSGSAGPLEGMDAHTALATSYSAWMDENATPEQKAAFQLYTMTSVYKQWNPYLRGQDQEGIGEKDIEQIRNLDAMIAQSDGAESDILVYRGIRDANSVFGTQAAAGTTIVDDAFVSTTMDHGIKEHYAGSDASGAVMTIKIPQGTPIAVAKTEGQVLLPTRTKMKIVSDQTVEQIVDQAGYDMLLDMGFNGDELQERLELYKVVQVTRTIEAEVVT